MTEPDGAQGRDNLALHGQARVHRILSSLERLLISALEAIVLAGAHCHVEGLARKIFQAAAARAIEAWAAQRSPVTNSQTGGADPTGGADVLRLDAVDSDER